MARGKFESVTGNRVQTAVGASYPHGESISGQVFCLFPGFFTHNVGQEAWRSVQSDSLMLRHFLFSVWSAHRFISHSVDRYTFHSGILDYISHKNKLSHTLPQSPVSYYHTRVAFS